MMVEFNDKELETLHDVLHMQLMTEMMHLENCIDEADKKRTNDTIKGIKKLQKKTGGKYYE